MCDLTEPPLLSAHFSDAENVSDCRKANPMNSVERCRQLMPPVIMAAPQADHVLQGRRPV
jgi:hypothetical protein